MSPQPPGRGRLPLDGTCQQEGQLQAGKAGGSPLCEPVLSCQPTGSITICRPGAARTLQALPVVGGQLWTVGTKSSCAGFSPRQTQASALLPARSLLSPWALQAPALGGTSPSTRRGRWLFPQKLPGLAAEGRAPGPHRDQRSRPLEGTSWVARCNRTIPATFSAAHVKPADLRLPNVQIGRPQGALPVSNVDKRRRGPRGGVGVRGDSRGVALAAREGRAGVRLAEL